MSAGAECRSVGRARLHLGRLSDRRVAISDDFDKLNKLLATVTIAVGVIDIILIVILSSPVVAIVILAPIFKLVRPQPTTKLDATDLRRVAQPAAGSFCMRMKREVSALHR